MKVLPKSVKAFSNLCLDFKTLKSDFLAFKSKAPTVINGQDGVSPDPDEIVKEILAKLPTPRDGKDGVSPVIRDVADIVLANIRPPKDGVSPDLNVVAIEAAKLIPKPRDGISPTPMAIAKQLPVPKRGERGPAGKDGTSVTAVELKNNELFVSLDGKRKKAGAIKLPATTAPFRPGSNDVGGGAGSLRDFKPLVEQIVDDVLEDGPIPITSQDMSNALTNFEFIDAESKLSDPVDGEHVLSTGTYEFLDDPITGSSLIIIDPLVPGAGQLIIIRGDKLANPLVYVGGGAFIRATVAEAPLAYIQLNFLLVSVGGTAFDYAGGFSVFVQNFSFFGDKGYGNIEDVAQFVAFEGASTAFSTTFDTPLTVSRVLSFQFTGTSFTTSTVMSGPLVVVEDVSSVSIKDIFYQPQSGQSFLRISPIMPLDATIRLANNDFNDILGGDFFEEGVQGNITAFADNSSTGSILAFTDNGSGGTTVTTDAPHGLSSGRIVTQTGTTNYNDTVAISAASGSVYDISIEFNGNDATGTWTFNSVTVTSVSHSLLDGAVVNIDKTTNYNVGRGIFGVLTDSFKIDNIEFNGDDAAGIWDSGSLKQDDTRMNVSSNGSQPDTAQLAVSLIEVTELITVTTMGQFEPITTWVSTIQRQFTSNAPGEAVGTLRYEGREITAGVEYTVTGQMVAGGAKIVAFALFIKPDGGSFAQVGQALTIEFSTRTATLTGFIPGIDLTELDVVQLRTTNTEDTVNFNIDEATLSVFAQAQGFL